MNGTIDRIDDYRNADCGKRLHLFLQHRDQRTRYMKIEMEESRRKHPVRGKPRGSGFPLIGLCKQFLQMFM